MSGGGKGGKKTEETTIPDWLRGPAQRNLERAEAVQQIEYMPYYGPDVAAFTPAQNAAFDTNISAAEAFGLVAPNSGLTATSGMPTPTDWDGFTGYSSQPIYESALAELQAKQAQLDTLCATVAGGGGGGGGGGSGGGSGGGAAAGAGAGLRDDYPARSFDYLEQLRAELEAAAGKGKYPTAWADIPPEQGILAPFSGQPAVAMSVKWRCE